MGSRPSNVKTLARPRDTPYSTPLAKNTPHGWFRLRSWQTVGGRTPAAGRRERAAIGRGPHTRFWLTWRRLRVPIVGNLIRVKQSRRSFPTRLCSRTHSNSLRITSRQPPREVNPPNEKLQARCPARLDWVVPKHQSAIVCPFPPPPPPPLVIPSLCVPAPLPHSLDQKLTP